jgi:hypothetical protein
LEKYYSELRALRAFVVKNIVALSPHIQRSQENSDTSTVPANMPVTALLVL